LVTAADVAEILGLPSCRLPDWSRASSGPKPPDRSEPTLRRPAR